MKPDQFSTDKIRAVTRGWRGGKIPLQNCSPPWSNVLGTVENYRTWFKKVGPLSENSSPPLVSQAGYGPGLNTVSLKMN